MCVGASVERKKQEHEHNVKADELFGEDKQGA